MKGLLAAAHIGEGFRRFFEVDDRITAQLAEKQ